MCTDHAVEEGNHVTTMHGPERRPSDQAADPHLERRQIEQVVADAERLQNDPDGFCRLLTPDVVLVNVAGTRLVGRDAVRQAMQAALRTPLADVVTTNEVDRISFVRPDVALMSGTKRVFIDADGTRSESFRACLTFVLVKDDGEWLIAAIQNTPVRGDVTRREDSTGTGDRMERERALSVATAVPLPGGFGLLPPKPNRNDR